MIMIAQDNLHWYRNYAYMLIKQFEYFSIYMFAVKSVIFRVDTPRNIASTVKLFFALGFIPYCVAYINVCNVFSIKSSLFCPWIHCHSCNKMDNTHWNENVIILMVVSSLAAPKVVILTTFGAASDEDFIKMKTFSFQCICVFCRLWTLSDLQTQSG